MVICMIRWTKKIGDRGEIVIPKSLRKEIGIKPNQKVELIGSKKGIFIIPLVDDIKVLRGLFSKEGIKNLDKIEEAMFEAMAGN